MTEQQVQSLLTSVKARYIDLAKRDILNTLSQFRDLRPATDCYVFNDGSRSQVVTLSGTIPVSYKGNTYNIPICAYLVDTHPYYPPICYVRPTPDMVIRPGKHVDNSGKVYLPYLHEWRHPQSDLIGLFQVMAIEFGENCPLFSRSASTPNNLSGSGGYGYPSNNAPYPLSSPFGMPTPSPPSSGTPPYPPASRTPYPPYPAPVTAAPTGSAANYAPSQSYASAYPTRVGTATIQPEHIRLSLISAVEDKLRSKLRDSIGTSYAELQSIKKTREDLTAGEKKLKTMLLTLQQEQDTIDSAQIAYRDYIDAAEKTITQSSQSEQMDIDDAIDTTTPLFRQLLACYVEDSAIEDTIYYLGQSLKSGGIDLDNYLRQVRTLSRQQFMLRATMQRCRRVAGLDA